MELACSSSKGLGPLGVRDEDWRVEVEGVGSRMRFSIPIILGKFGFPNGP